MRKGRDISAKFDGLYLVHQNLPGKAASAVQYDQHILFIPLQGEIGIQIGRDQVSLGSGQMLYLAPKTLHSFSSSRQSGERLIAMGDLKLIKSHSKVRYKKIPLHQLIKEILFYLLIHKESKSAGALVKVFGETLTEALDHASSQSIELEHLEGRVLDPRIRTALDFIQKNATGSFSMDEAARKAGLSGRNFNRLVLKETGIQPKQWLINYRVDRAKELLKKPGISVTQVAFEVGYNSLGQFISAFRSRTGQLPSEFLRHG